MLSIYNDLSFRPPRPMGIPWLRRRGIRNEDRIPRVLVETPAPPVLREERIGKGMPAGVVLRPACLLSACSRIQDGSVELTAKDYRLWFSSTNSGERLLICGSRLLTA